MKKRVPKLITNKEDLDELFSLSGNSIGTEALLNLIGDFGDGPRMNPYDEIYLEPGIYGKGDKKNKKRQLTTVGIYIFNKIFIEEELFDLFKYINHEIDNKYYNSVIVEKLRFSLIEDDISCDVVGRFLKKTQKIMPFSTIISPTISMDILTSDKLIEGKKKELIKKNKEAIEKGDPVVANKIEKELLDYLTDKLKDDPGMDTYTSGARSVLDNDFKNMYVMTGSIRNSDPNADKPYDIALSNYMKGISRDEYALLSKSLAAGPYARAKKTEVGGYWEKLFVSAYQHIQLDPPGSDCGTTDTEKVTLTDKNVNDWMYSYIKTSSGLVELTSKNKDKYIGKTVNFRFSSMCESKTGICNACAGNLFYRTDKRNIGISVSNIPSVLKLRSMKAFHNAQVTTSRLDLMKAFGFEE